ncbi:MAG: VOC family protein [Defluviitaleaceae bacterium]|nr:VOC family protein [Defluviitaleaceae bacterium]
MLTGVEIDMVVKDSIKALELYEKIFDIERVEITDMGEQGSEAVFTIYGTRFHLLNENHDFHLYAPQEGVPQSMWLNISVPDIKTTYNAAIAAGCKEIFGINDMPDFGVKNAMFADPFGYGWMLHQIDRIVSHKERVEILRKQGEK